MACACKPWSAGALGRTYVLDNQAAEAVCDEDDRARTDLRTLEWRKGPRGQDAPCCVSARRARRPAGRRPAAAAGPASASSGSHRSGCARWAPLSAGILRARKSRGWPRCRARRRQSRGRISGCCSQSAAARATGRGRTDSNSAHSRGSEMTVRPSSLTATGCKMGWSWRARSVQAMHGGGELEAHVSWPGATRR